MGEVKQIETKNGTYYFYNDMTKSITNGSIFTTLDTSQLKNW